MLAPDMQEKRKYIFHTDDRLEWSDEQYFKFLQGLDKYYQDPINNKKIARFIDTAVRPNHVRYIKGQYLRNIKKRAREQKIS